MEVTLIVSGKNATDALKVCNPLATALDLDLSKFNVDSYYKIENSFKCFQSSKQNYPENAFSSLLLKLEPFISQSTVIVSSRYGFKFIVVVDAEHIKIDRVLWILLESE